MENTNATGDPNVDRPVNSEANTAENTSDTRKSAEKEDRISDSGNTDSEEGYRPRSYRPAGGYSRNGEGANRPYYRRNAQDGENGRRPYYNRYQDGNEGDRRSFRRDDNNGERRPYRRFDEDGGTRRPYRQNGEDNGERRPYRRYEDGGNQRPYYRRDAQDDGESGRRPYYSRRQDGNYGEKRPYRRDDSNGERRPYRQNGEDNGERRPYRRQGDGNTRPYYRRDAQDDGTNRRPYYNRRADDNYGERRPYRRDGNEDHRPYYTRRDEEQPVQDNTQALQNLGPDTGNMYTPEDYEGHTPVQPDNGNAIGAPRQKRKRIVRATGAPHYSRVDANDRPDNGYSRNEEAPRTPRRPAPKPKARKKIVVPDYPDVVYTEPLRLNKYIANSGLCSRREADEYIQAGRIAVNGQIVSELGVKVNPTDVVTFDGKDLMPERKVYVLLNKPKGFVTSLDDEKDRKTVMDLVHYACRERIYPVGRLDRQTTGVLLFTNDGELALKLTHPANHMRKIYQVQLDRAISEEDLKRLADGIDLDDGFIAPDAVAYANDEDPSQVGVEIHSGRNRIVRRMFEAIGYNVKKLDRVYFAGLSKKGLKRGKWRFLSPQEVAFLKMMPSN
ncbi:MAG: pseudouridine synthase [Bacteroidales bacterium]|nr:pseudouridine synthase [Bacteroidales bacterium]